MTGAELKVIESVVRLFAGVTPPIQFPPLVISVLVSPSQTRGAAKVTVVRYETPAIRGIPKNAEVRLCFGERWKEQMKRRRKGREKR